MFADYWQIATPAGLIHSNIGGGQSTDAIGLLQDRIYVFSSRLGDRIVRRLA
jgi:hypothetical protein